jgi:translation initiation factor 4A
MLATGFKEQLQNIFHSLPEDIQIALFSATLPDYAFDDIKLFMKDPVHIIVKKEALTLEGIAQYYVALEDDNQKYATLKDLYANLNVSQCIIYCNSIERVANLTSAMIEDGYPVVCIHGDMERKEREKAITDFRTGSHRVLISSNVTARGIDIQQVSVVINFDICKSVHTYLHRIGRSGRWGRKGVGINFVTRRDISKLRFIERYYSTQVNELPTNFMENIV